MTNRHQRIVNLSIRTNGVIGKLQDRAGTSKKNVGPVRLYNEYRPILREQGEDENRIDIILGSLRRDLQDFLISHTDEIYLEVQAYLERYGEVYPVLGITDLPFTQQEFIAGALQIFDNQRGVLLTNIRNGQENAVVFGDSNLVNLFSVGLLIRYLANSITNLFSLSLLRTPEFQQNQVSYSKQSIAALDFRTTRCCIDAHGQIVPFDAKFHTPESPSFAEHQSWSPFHFWCRTTIAVVRTEDLDDDITQRLLSNRQRFLG